MRSFRYVLVMALAVSLSLTSAGCRKPKVATDPNRTPAAQSVAESSVRFIHGVPGAPPVDIYLNDRLAAAGLAYRMASAYAPLPAESVTARITAAGATASLIGPSAIDFPAPGVYTIVVSGNATGGDLKAIALAVERIAPDAGRARIRVVNASDAPAVDLLVNDRIAISDLPAGRATGAYAQWDAGNYRVTVQQSGTGSALLGPVPMELKAGASYTAVLFGSAATRSLSLQLYPDR